MRHGTLACALLLLSACGRAGLDLPTDELGGGGEGGAGAAGGSGGAGAAGGSGGAGGAGGSGGAGGAGGGFCGDGALDPDEACDDGNASNEDACLVGCVSAACGDGFLWVGVEGCDDGNLIDGDGCSSACALPTCGDGNLDVGEQCDDGNTLPGDGCSPTCQLPFCGDGTVDPGEACDDANASNTDDCLVGCVAASCGDGFVRAGVEQCDDGNLIPGDGCSPSCQLPFCGDGTVDAGESCDLGAMNESRPALSFRQGTAIPTPLSPYDNAQSAVLFYNYFSASSHTGFEAAGTSRAYFYRNVGNGVLSLIVHHGIDQTTSGISTPQSFVDMAFSGLPSATFVGFADDAPQELFKNGATTAVGDWGFQDNTDGGVIAGFPIPGSWEVTIAATFGGAPLTWELMDGESQAFYSGLDPAQPLVLQAFDSPAACRLDCTVPACGDGELDGGEVCDDGNTTGGDGCSATCSSLN